MCRFAYKVLLLSSLTTALSGPTAAFAAESTPSLNLRGFNAPTDAASGLYLEPASSPETLDWNAGLWLVYAYRPITLRDAATDAIRFEVIGHQLTGDFTAAVGFGGRVMLGVDFPFLLAQGGDDATEDSTRVLGTATLPRQALGDLGVTGKLTLVKPTAGDLGGFALALHERFTVPTGDPESYLGEGHITSETRLLGEYRLVALGMHAAAGVKLRSQEERFACADVPAPQADGEDACAARFGHELPFGLGLSFRPQVLGIDDAGRWTWFLESHGHVPLSPSAPFSRGSGRVAALSVGAGARLAVGRDVSLFAGVETGVLAGVGSSPVRGMVSVSWAPRVHDADGDGVEDEKDQCKELAEDLDRFEDHDGCPDGDNDDDGVPDDDDRCPAEREDEDGFDDDDGCIDPDNDRDTIPDTADACPDEAGPASAVAGGKSGCPVRDVDGDGIQSEKDKCPEAAEDKDGFEDDDGCPEADNDDDEIPDAVDACPDAAGADSPNAKEKGCPDPDRDRDTYLDADDKCPGEAEAWNGIDDADGCPDGDPKKNVKALVAIKDAKGGPVVQLEGGLKFAGASDLDAASVPLLRALASELLKHPEWSVAVGARPKPKGGDEEAKARAAAVVDALRRFTRREKAAEVVGWADVKDVAGASVQGIGLKILVAKP